MSAPTRRPRRAVFSLRSTPTLDALKVVAREHSDEGLALTALFLEQRGEEHTGPSHDLTCSLLALQRLGELLTEVARDSGLSVQDAAGEEVEPSQTAEHAEALGRIAGAALRVARLVARDARRAMGEGL